jgi:hypothetical protein
MKFTARLLKTADENDRAENALAREIVDFLNECSIKAPAPHSMASRPTIKFEALTFQEGRVGIFAPSAQNGEGSSSKYPYFYAKTLLSIECYNQFEGKVDFLEVNIYSLDNLEEQEAWNETYKDFKENLLDFLISDGFHNVPGYPSAYQKSFRETSE